MATCESTTPRRRNRSAFATFACANLKTDDCAAPLFVKTGEVLERAPDAVVMEHARRLIAAQFRPGALVLEHVDRLRQFVTLQLGDRKREVFALILLDRRRRLIDYVELFQGTLDTTAVYPRHVLECVIEHRADSVILIHNHPSGIAEPSGADIMITERLRRALALIDVRILDHLIVAESIFSFAERGMIC